uniref:Uncharacterized protein n=1 Tax=Aegilops tauschii subsp. strangulata TaxID=200361 RepID=A0A453NUU4_AEGTS
WSSFRKKREPFGPVIGYGTSSLLCSGKVNQSWQVSITLCVSTKV